MTTELATIPQQERNGIAPHKQHGGLTAMPLSDVMTLGSVFAQSGYFSDAKQQAQAVVKIMAGAELGLPPIASMQGIHVIQGKPTLSSNLMAGAVKRSGRYDYRVLKLTDVECDLAFLERIGGQWQEIGRTQFTANDAKRADVKNMGKFPRNMLFARAMSNGVRFYCPDVFYGPVYTPEEFGGEMDESGNVTVVEFQSSTPVPVDDEDALRERGMKYFFALVNELAKSGMKLSSEDSKRFLQWVLEKPVPIRKSLSSVEWATVNNVLKEMDANALREVLTEGAGDVVEGTLAPVSEMGADGDGHEPEENDPFADE